MAAATFSVLNNDYDLGGNVLVVLNPAMSAALCEFIEEAAEEGDLDKSDPADTAIFSLKSQLRIHYARQRCKRDGVPFVDRSARSAEAA